MTGWKGFALAGAIGAAIVVRLVSTESRVTAQAIETLYIPQSFSRVTSMAIETLVAPAPPGPPQSVAVVA